jgi:hypothetical protein
MSLRNVYHTLEGDRNSWLEQAYRSSVFTIPSVLPREGLTRDNLPQNYQSIGARGVNNLVSKLRLTLFPIDLPFFRLVIDPFAERAMVAEMGPEEAAKARAEITKNLALIEETVRSTFQTDGWGPVMTECLKHLIIAGNGCVLVDPERGPQFVDLRRFVAERDPEGNLLRVVIRQTISDVVIEEKFGTIAAFKTLESTVANLPSPTPSAAKLNYLYTGAIRNKMGSWDFSQEVNGVVVPESNRTYTTDKLPLLVLRWTPVSGENYGMGYVEDFHGDMLSLEALSRALVEGALAASKVNFFVRPGGATRMRALATAPNGGILSGTAEDVTVLNVQKQGDFAVANQRAAVIEQRLSYAFLLFSSVQRQAERVTAEEVRIAAQELEDALGGVYTALSSTVQKPLVMFMLNNLKKRQDMPALPKNVKPIVATGLEAISRGHKATRLLQLGTSMQQIVGPEETSLALRSEIVARELAVAYQIDPDTVIRTSEEVAELRQQQTNQSLVETLGPNAINAAASQPQ